jgi:hypothetical protein
VIQNEFENNQGQQNSAQIHIVGLLLSVKTLVVACRMAGDSRFVMHCYSESAYFVIASIATACLVESYDKHLDLKSSETLLLFHFGNTKG